VFSIRIFKVDIQSICTSLFVNSNFTKTLLIHRVSRCPPLIYFPAGQCPLLLWQTATTTTIKKGTKNPGAGGKKSRKLMDGQWAMAPKGAGFRDRRDEGAWQGSWVSGHLLWYTYINIHIYIYKYININAYITPGECAQFVVYWRDFFG